MFLSRKRKKRGALIRLVLVVVFGLWAIFAFIGMEEANNHVNAQRIIVLDE